MKGRICLHCERTSDLFCKSNLQSSANIQLGAGTTPDPPATKNGSLSDDDSARRPDGGGIEGTVRNSVRYRRSRRPQGTGISALDEDANHQ
jgi:hypothetical protein